MIRPSIDRFTLAVNTRTILRPTDKFHYRSVNVGNGTPGDLQIDFGDPTRYAVIIAGGWRLYNFVWPVSLDGTLQQFDLPGGIFFYGTAIMGGVVIAEWE